MVLSRRKFLTQLAAISGMGAAFVFQATRSDQAARASSSLGMHKGLRAPQLRHSTCVA